jgi:hypothetical protein
MGEESGKFILGVIAIVLLLVLAFKLVGILRQNNQQEQAEASLDRINIAMNSLADGESQKLTIESPLKWFLIPFVRAQLSSSDIPKNCLGERCLCLCPKVSKEKCEEGGVCKSINKEFSVVGREICSPRESPRTYCILLDPVPVEIILTRKDKQVEMVRQLEESRINNV